MANWCSNYVLFYGQEESISQLQVLFEKMVESQKKDGLGQLPDFIDSKHGFLFDIVIQNSEQGVFQFETTWSPNIEIIKKIGEHFSLDYIHEYEEMNNLVYGRATYENGNLIDIYLENEDFDLYQYDEYSDCYQFEGERYEGNIEILETILQRRISQHDSFNRPKR